MTWEELCEKAQELGYIIDNDYHIMSNDNRTYIHTMHYYKEGVINTEHYEDFCFVADHRTPEQMYQIMEALQ